MKVNMRKILSVLLVLCMVLSSVPFPTRAADAGEATTTNGSYDASGNWVAGGTGSATYDVDGTLVTLSKTATPVAGQENVFNINLRVETSTTTTTYVNSGAVVLVIDVSGSMNYCADCGNEQGEEHDDECPKNEPYTDRWGRERNSDVENSDSRMLAAMGAAANFLKTYAGTDPNAARMLAIVSFQSSASIRMNWVNVAGGAGQNGYDTALSTIYALGAGGGTNLDDGLYQARSLLNSSDVANITSKNVVALTDGAPTRSRSAGDGTRGSATINDHTATQAANVRALATLYTVCFGVRNEETYSGGPTVGNFLSGSVATGGCAYNADNSAQLYGVFAAITESITSGLSGSGWTATDPMADMIAVSSAPGNFTGSGNGTYTWSLGDPVETIVDGNKTTYVYTVTYQVTLDVQGQDFVEGQFFPTNEHTYLNLGDGQTLEFPVPGVKGRLPRTDISVTKVWNDAENQDGIRSESVTVQLKNEAGVVIGGDVVLNADNGWSHTWDGETYNLIAKSKGVDHKYTVVELDAPAGYTPSVTQNGFAFTVTNSHETAKQDITVTKKWDDANDQDGKRPEVITVNLLADGEVFATVELNADNGWSHTFRGLDVNKAGKAIAYTVEEVNVPDGYTASVDGMTITNSHETIKTEVSVQKIWDDADNQDGKRPGSVTVRLYADDVDTGKTLTLSDANNWTDTFTGLEKYRDGGVEIEYTITEDAVEYYNDVVITGSQADGYTVTNTHVPETIVISGSKSWDDNNNQDGKRPSSITINLLADNVVVRTVTVSAENGWQWSFAGMPKYANGKLINYTIQEAAVEGYTPVYSGYNVTNVHTPATTLVEVVKIWDDAEDQDGKRPTEITVRLLANGTEVDSKVLNSGGGWKARFENLPVYENGREITYTITEDPVTGYETSIDGYTVTNTHVPETVEVSGQKTWNDNDDQDGKRPESITINLLADNEVIDSVTVTAEDGWKWSFTELPKYKAGKEISYSVTENAVENYSTVIDGYDVTNSYTPEQTSITVSKVWNDANNQDGIRPASVTVNLMADGKVVATQTLNSGNEWKHTFTNLPVYRNGGVEIVYTVDEVSVPEYTTVITGDKVTGFTVTNSYTPKTLDISGSKTWDDNNDQDGARPDSITINLLADNKIIDTAVVTAENGWKWSFVNLPEFRDGGVKIEYAISENAVDGYISTVNGYSVTNKHDPEKINLSVNKVWEDKNDQDGIRPDSIVVNLMNGETVVQTATLTAADGWSYTFEDLDKFAEGVEIQYSIEEIAVTGYNTVISGTTGERSFTVTNSHTPETTVVSGSKTWNDAENQDDVRPESITIRLHADGKEIDSVTVTEAEDWKWSFENLPKYRDGGMEIVYTVTEDAVKEYTGAVNGFNVTNTHSPYETSVSVSKTWEDNNDQDGIRPEFITVILLANGKEVQTAVLNEGNSWSHTFTNLPVNEAGVEIVYTVDEQSVPGYEKVITGNPEKGFHITNSYTPETTSVSGTKTWADNNDQDGKRPDSIVITLLKDGVEYMSAEVTAENGWSWSFENLPKYRDHGVDIVYSIKEVVVDQYVTEYNGYDVTNTHAPEKTSVTVSKAWADKDNQDGIRPNDVTVVLLANGEKTDKTLVLSNGNNWTGSFTELDKYADGEEIKYTIEEMPVEGYEPVISGSHEDGFQITNVHVPETIAISGSKTWDDNDNQDGFRPESITIRLKANGKEVAVVTVTEAEEWAWTFENLPKFEAGEEIEYTITEDAVADYSTEYDGFNMTNTHTPEQTSITVTKAWEDKNDQDGIRPDEITVILLANGEETGDKLVLDEENNWTGSFTELDKYAEGEEITYTVEEIEIEGYETTITGDVVEGFVITNCHTPETISISGAKTWDDNNDQDGKRPDEITVNLMANGNVVDTLVVTEADGWAWTFENLPKYENHGEEITYAITETAVEGYTTTYDGYNITNSYTPAQTSVTVTKAWADSNDEDGLRPKKITITLYANGKLTDKTLVLTADDNWSGSFVGLPKYEAGEEIVYTIGEIAVEGYNTVIRGSMGAGFVVTNSHTVIPQTGDERTPVLWILLMLASVAAVGYVYTDTKKRRMNCK